MRKDFLIKDCKNFIGKEVTTKGWAFNKRSSGAIIFLQVRDGTGFIQAIVLKKNVSAEVFKLCESITLETSIIIKGLIKEEKRAPRGFELSVTDLEIVSASPDDYPIGKKEHGPDFLLVHRHLWLRSKRQWAILRIRNKIIEAINEYLQKENFTRIDTPIITPIAAEGTTSLFEIDYFGEKAFLSQTGQLYLEAAIFSFGKVYDFGPVLRAEKSKTRRHLIEFWMMDAEVAFVNYSEILEIEERLIEYLIKKVLENCREEFKILERNVTPLQQIKLPFKRFTYAQIIKKLQELGSDIKFGTDFGNDDETLLMNHFKQPIFVTHYPVDIKAFYCKRDKKDKKLALAADLLAPEGFGEIIGGGEREDDFDKLVTNIKEHDYKLSDYDWYLDLRKYGSVPHSGFGIGLERLVAWICRLDHVRESIPFPRMLERFRP